jgi:hypothetical protein
MTVVWFTNVGNFIQMLVITSAIWILYHSGNAFVDLSVNVYITQYVPWLLPVKTLIVELLGEFGRWILTIPILVLAPLKFIGGTIIGGWAYSVARKMPRGPVYT